MNLRQSIANLILPKEYKLGSPVSGGSLQFFSMQNPPGWTYDNYLKAYGQIGILFSVVNVITQAVCKVEWHLYEIDTDLDQTEITHHPLLDLFNNPNQFQSRYQFFYEGTLYKLLVGEEFWQMNFNGKGQPAELWQAPPAYMAVVPHPTSYIDHYEFRRGNMAKPIPFTLDEIIHIKSPNPTNPYRGISPAQALTADLDLTRYGKMYQAKTFYNDGRPGFIIEYPPEGMPPAETRKELQQEYDERHKGVRNTGKTLFLWGGKANVITMTNKDMDYQKLSLMTRDEICAAYHCPPSVLGITEMVNRSNAETSQYQLAQYCVHPELCEIRDAINNKLVPFFGTNLRMDFENPIPEDATAKAANAVQLYKAGAITLNEARDAIDMEPDDRTEAEIESAQPGDQYFKAPTPQMGTGSPDETMNPTDAGAGGTKDIHDLIEAHWRAHLKEVKSRDE